VSDRFPKLYEAYEDDPLCAGKERRLNLGGSPRGKRGGSAGFVTRLGARWPCLSQTRCMTRAALVRQNQGIGEAGTIYVAFARVMLAAIIW